jgi:lysozyme family protein
MMNLDYESLFKSMVREESMIPAFVIRSMTIKRNTLRYKITPSVPWYVIAILHSLETGCDFTRHLHNGDPLSARTVHVPKGRPWLPPKNGVAYTWEESALDALSGRWKPTEWTIYNILKFFECYNGMGYRDRGIHSPYLWAYTNHYTSGLFVADGTFDPNAKSKNLAAAPLLRTMINQGLCCP